MWLMADAGAKNIPDFKKGKQEVPLMSPSRLSTTLTNEDCVTALNNQVE
jgi:hypothetical protein